MTDSINIIVPSYGRPEQLRRTLAALGRQEGGPYPTTVVDDGSPEPLEPVCHEAGPWVTCIRQDNAGPAAARNTGARESRAKMLCFTDDDCLPRPGWARALAAALGGDRTRLVGGRVMNALADNVFAETSQSLVDWIHAYHTQRSHAAQYFTSNNIGCDRRAFLDAGGFDQTFPLAAAEDRDFGVRWRRMLGPLVFAPDAIVDHAHPLDLSRFWRQHSNYGRGARQLHKRPASADDSEQFETPGFYAGLLLHPLTDRSRPLRRRIAGTALTGLSQMAMVAGYLRERRAESRAS